MGRCALDAAQQLFVKKAAAGDLPCIGGTMANHLVQPAGDALVMYVYAVMAGHRALGPAASSDLITRCEDWTAFRQYVEGAITGGSSILQSGR